MAYLTYLHTFLAIYRSGSITKASKYLNLSQPAVSGQLRTLETQIGRDLFTRTSRGIIPTAAGTARLRRGSALDIRFLGERFRKRSGGKKGGSGGSEFAGTYGTRNRRSRDHRSAAILLRG